MRHLYPISASMAWTGDNIRCCANTLREQGAAAIAFPLSLSWWVLALSVSQTWAHCLPAATMSQRSWKYRSYVALFSTSQQSDTCLEWPRGGCPRWQNGQNNRWPLYFYEIFYSCLTRFGYSRLSNKKIIIVFCRFLWCCRIGFIRNYIVKYYRDLWIYGWDVDKSVLADLQLGVVTWPAEGVTYPCNA